LNVSDTEWLDIEPRAAGDGSDRSGRVQRSFRESFAALPLSPRDTSASLVLLTPFDACPATNFESGEDLIRLAWLRPGACVGWWTRADGEAGPFRSADDALTWAWSHPDGIHVRSLEPNPGDPNSSTHVSDSGTVFPHIAMPTGRSLGPAASVVESLARRCAETFLPRDSRVGRMALLAGLLTQHDHFDAAHTAAQAIEGDGQPAWGDHWHAILHRREPDYGNARYWYRHVGKSPVFARLGEWVARVGTARFTLASDVDRTAEIAVWSHRLVRDGVWQPYAMIDLCEACAARAVDDPLVRFAAAVQAREMSLLLEAILGGA
jgi:hypothetical protein